MPLYCQEVEKVFISFAHSLTHSLSRVESKYFHNLIVRCTVCSDVIIGSIRMRICSNRRSGRASCVKRALENSQRSRPGCAARKVEIAGMEGKVTAPYSEEKGFKFPKGLDWVEQVAVYGGQAGRQAGARGRVAPVRGANSSQTFHINSCCSSHFLALLNLGFSFP